ncbi:MAG: hypothetical protein ACK5KL_20375 [Dysgonomonas sp.]
MKIAINIDGKTITKNPFVLDAAKKQNIYVKDLPEERYSLIWNLYSRKDQIASMKNKDSVNICISNRLSGCYTYKLEVLCYSPGSDKIIKKEKINVRGKCERKMIDISANYPDKSTIDKGVCLKFDINTEGLNGNNLRLVFFSDDKEVGKTKWKKCVEGTVSLVFSGKDTNKWKKGAQIKVKLEPKEKEKGDNKYISQNGSSEDIFTLNISNQENSVIEYEAPANNSVSTIDQFKYDSNKESIELTVDKIEEINVCEMFSCSASCSGPVDESAISWRVVVCKKDDVATVSGKFSSPEVPADDTPSIKLEDVKINGVKLQHLTEQRAMFQPGETDISEQIKLKGKDICFPVPKEWGQCRVVFIAYLPEINAKSNPVYVRDHVAAAFFRLNIDNPESFQIKNVKEIEYPHGILDQYILPILTMPITPIRAILKIDLPPFCHIQGVFRQDKKLYVCGSTPNGRAPYIYVADKDESTEEGWTYKNTIIFNKGILSSFEHPGGLQVADDFLAIGMEQYNWTGAMTDNRGITTVLDINPDRLKVAAGLASNLEEPTLRVIKDSKYKSRYKAYSNKDGAKSQKVKLFVKGNKILLKKEDKAEEVELLDIIDENGYIKKEYENINDVEIYDQYGIRIDDKYKSVDVLVKHPNRPAQNTSEVTYEDDRASAAGIVSYEKGKHLVGIRGNDNGVYFYTFQETKILAISDKSFTGVGDFQNLNLFKVPNKEGEEEIYMFGMGDESKTETIYTLKSAERFQSKEDMVVKKSEFPDLHEKLSKLDKEFSMDVEDELSIAISSISYTMTKKILRTSAGNTCRLFKVTMAGDMVSGIEAVWINPSGIIQTSSDYENTDKNRQIFACASGNFPRFHWSSCVYLNVPKDPKKQKDLKIGFLGDIMVYTTGALVEHDSVYPDPITRDSVETNFRISCLSFKEKE